MYEIPTSISIGEQSFAIRNRGDYRMVLDCFTCLSDYDLTEQERLYACLIIFYEDFNDLEDILGLDVELIGELTTKMFNFFNCNNTHSGIKTSFKAIDWDTDSQLICSAVNKIANVEVRAVEYLHWWTFMGYFTEIGESTLATVVGIRNKIMKGKKLEKYEREFRNSNPQYFVWDSRTAQQMEDDALLKELWNFNS